MIYGWVLVDVEPVLAVRDDVIVMRPKVFLGHVECYYFVREAILKFCTE